MDIAGINSARSEEVGNVIKALLAPLWTVHIDAVFGPMRNREEYECILKLKMSPQPRISSFTQRTTFRIVIRPFRVQVANHATLLQPTSSQAA